MDGLLEEEWRRLVASWEVPAEEEAAVAELIADEPDRHDWRVVDAALDRLACPACGGRLSRGPVGCAPCDLAHGFRYVAIETDRPGVPWGNEHAIRVNVSVVRRPHVTSESELLVRRLVLPALLVGMVPTTRQAQRVSAAVKQASRAQRAALAERAIEELMREC
ncbi:hypothetical protein DEF23_23770 [Marinitenerispora sediminis]|uniref:Uncharacterized protein n=1 Tax=Marinitenerispora sediminis TaxID=1931232 RepID=A0A368T514_9ACTN|nr:hypothetical protein DEF28_24110 [Marinitenerispora sediminis]RCV49352.1 hypothetical protein DEF23_23770 [Marinitenerispora sediminis]RCV58689.1 hypothetical protein DEF24_12650 [Marinitenerispora sediminis]